MIKKENGKYYMNKADSNQFNSTKGFILDITSARACSKVSYTLGLSNFNGNPNISSNSCSVILSEVSVKKPFSSISIKSVSYTHLTLPTKRIV